MKRIQSACILQTIVFSQKPEAGFTREQAEKINRTEFETYQKKLEFARIRYQIAVQEVRDDGALVVHVRKQYNATNADEYFV